MIDEGRVSVNGEIVREQGRIVDPNRDVIVVDGRRIERPEASEYWIVHKPAGVITTVEDPHGRPTARQLVPTKARVYPVGRLDADSSGLLLFTNDGGLAHRLAHPSFEHRKFYHVMVSGYPSEATLDSMRTGVELDDGVTAPAQVTLHHTTATGTWLSIGLHEGRNRQIRRMCEQIGHPVVHLRRTAIGPLRLGRLKPGEARRLGPHEIEALRRSAAGEGSAGGSSGRRPADGQRGRQNRRLRGRRHRRR